MRRIKSCATCRVREAILSLNKVVRQNCAVLFCVGHGPSILEVATACKNYKTVGKKLGILGIINENCTAYVGMDDAKYFGLGIQSEY